MSNGHRIGEDRTACIVTDSSGSLCTTTVGLIGGFLEVVFPENLSSKNITAPITGGAGRYATTRGYFALHQLNPKRYRVTLHLQ